MRMSSSNRLLSALLCAATWIGCEAGGQTGGEGAIGVPGVDAGSPRSDAAAAECGEAAGPVARADADDDAGASAACPDDGCTIDSGRGNCAPKYEARR